MAEKKKDVAGKDKEPQVRGRSGPPSATRNERAQGGKGKHGGGPRNIPKVGKHDSGEGGSQDGGLH
jgi:hypothetical protein